MTGYYEAKPFKHQFIVAKHPRHGGVLDEYGCIRRFSIRSPPHSLYHTLGYEVVLWNKSRIR